MLNGRLRNFATLGLLSVSGLNGCSRQSEGASVEDLAHTHQTLTLRLDELSNANSIQSAEIDRIRKASPDYTRQSIAPALGCAVGVINRGSHRSGVIFSVNYNEGSMKVLTSFHAFADVQGEISAAMTEQNPTSRAQKLLTVSTKSQVQVVVRVDGREVHTSGLIVAAEPMRDIVAVKTEIPNGFNPFWADPIRAKPAVGDAVLLVGNPSGFSQVVARGLFSDAHQGSNDLDANLRLAIISLTSSRGDSGAPVFAWNKDSGRWEWAGLIYGSPIGVSPVRLQIAPGLPVGSIPDMNSPDLIDAAGVQWSATSGLSSVILVQDIAPFLEASKHL